MSEEKINELNAAEAPVEATEQTANIANEETVEQVAAAAENTSARALPTTKEGVIERLKEIVAEGQDVDRNEIELLKQTYYKLHNASILAAREAFLANGGKVEEFMPAPDPEEENFKAQMVRIREMRAAWPWRNLKRKSRPDWKENSPSLSASRKCRQHQMRPTKTMMSLRTCRLNGRKSNRCQLNVRRNCGKTTNCMLSSSTTNCV